MTINTILQDNQLTFILQGRLDTTNAPKLEAELKKSISGAEKKYKRSSKAYF